MTNTIPKRIMAVNPGMQYLGIAILEGENLLWYSVKTFPGRKTLPSMRLEVQQFLAQFLQKYSPSVLAIEEPFYAPSLQSDNLKKLTRNIKTWGKWKGLRVYGYYPPAVKAFFCRDDPTKQSLAEAMVVQYPFLSQYLSVLGWKRPYWFHVFDAVGLGLMCHRKLTR